MEVVLGSASQAVRELQVAGNSRGVVCAGHCRMGTQRHSRWAGGGGWPPSRPTQALGGLQSGTSEGVECRILIAAGHQGSSVGRDRCRAGLGSGRIKRAGAAAPPVGRHGAGSEG